MSILSSLNFLDVLVKSLGLWVGAICHDLDHRGFNNKFMIDIGSPLAAVYSTSTMENHHFTMGVSILQRVRRQLNSLFLPFFFQEQNNIFANLHSDEYQKVLDTMKKCILATDLALFFPNKARLANIVKENSFEWEQPDHRCSVVCPV